jgi:hypothetical protein
MHSLDYSAEEERQRGGRSVVSTSGGSNGRAESSRGEKEIEWGVGWGGSVRVAAAGLRERSTQAWHAVVPPGRHGL